MPLVDAGTLDARRRARLSRTARPGDTVLLAPACASFDQFQSYEHRGEVFKQLVNAVGRTKNDMAQRLKTDWILFATVLAMVSFGLLILYSASSVMAKMDPRYRLELVFRGPPGWSGRLSRSSS